MARVLNPWSSKFDGSVGFLTFKQLGGQTVVSSKSQGPTNERTDLQIGNEKSMATLVAAGRNFKTVIDLNFVERAVKNTPKKCKNTKWGAFIGNNRLYDRAVFTYDTPENPVFFPDALTTALGTIEPTPMTTATGDVSAQTITVTYPTTSTGAGQQAGDLLNLVLYNETTDLWLGITAGATRAEGTWTSAALTGTGFSFIITDDVRVYTNFLNYFEDVDLGIERYEGPSSNSTNMIATLAA